jgi:hypothetical protein
MTISDLAGGYQLSVLNAIMSRFAPSSAARRDFLAACEERLGAAPLDSANKVRMPDDMWIYWSSVAAGRNGAYDAKGDRVAAK